MRRRSRPEGKTRQARRADLSRRRMSTALMWTGPPWPSILQRSAAAESPPIDDRSLWWILSPCLDRGRRTDLFTRDLHIMAATTAFGPCRSRNPQMVDEDIKAEMNGSKRKTSGSRATRPQRQPQGQRKRRRVGLWPRPLSGHALQGAVDQAARHVRRDPGIHERTRRAVEGQARIVASPGLPPSVEPSGDDCARRARDAGPRPAAARTPRGSPARRRENRQREGERLTANDVACGDSGLDKGDGKQHTQDEIGHGRQNVLERNALARVEHNQNQDVAEASPGRSVSSSAGSAPGSSR